MIFQHQWDNMMQNLLKITFLFLLLSAPAFANPTLSIGTTLSLLKINDPDFQYTSNRDQLQLSSVSFALSERINKSPFIASISTNRLINRSVDREVVSKKNGVFFTNKTKIKADTLTIGYQMGRYIPNFGLTNVGVEKSLYYAGKFLMKKQQTALIPSIGLTFIANKDISINSTIIAPNKELNLDAGVVFGVNYNFQL